MASLIKYAIELPSSEYVSKVSLLDQPRRQTLMQGSLMPFKQCPEKTLPTYPSQKQVFENPR
jgi:hypothetical protein